MIKNVPIERDRAATDIIPYFVGREKCEAGHKFGPHIREHFILHFCLSGKGRLYDKFGEHHIGAGELFIIRAKEVTTYVADRSDPWEYAWLAFDGALASRFADAPSVNPFDEDISKRLLSYIDSEIRVPEIYTALIFELIHMLSVGVAEPRDVISEVKRFIKLNYMENISVESIARTFGFERSYLFRSFKARYGSGVKEYITEVRMRKARELLREGYAVSETAFIVGYLDEFNFSKAYKKHFGVPPICDKARRI